MWARNKRMKIYVGVKKSDHNFLSKNLDKTVNYIIWPDSFKKIKDSVFLTIKEKKIVNSCYIHYSGYQKLSSEDLETFENRCINLHPALPKYPGVGGINRALYEEEATFGITVHLMNNRIDNGRILEVITFPINKFKFLDEAIYILNNKRLELIKKII
jgi:methionyl-tRNA formyltransferase